MILYSQISGASETFMLMDAAQVEKFLSRRIRSKK